RTFKGSGDARSAGGESRMAAWRQRSPRPPSGGSPMHRLRFALLAAASALILLTAAPGLASAASFDVTVHPGDSIQAALDRAAAGARIHVLGGTYNENLLIRKPVTLVGTGVVLNPPVSPTANACNQGGTVTGICVIGHVDASFNLISRVHDVSIRGFAVAGFS